MVIAPKIYFFSGLIKESKEPCRSLSAGSNSSLFPSFMALTSVVVFLFTKAASGVSAIGVYFLVAIASKLFLFLGLISIDVSFVMRTPGFEPELMPWEGIVLPG